MSLTWKSPIRRNREGQLLPSLPNEIYLHIFGDLRSELSDPNEPLPADYRRLLCNIALVCRYFCALMVPQVFHTLAFTRDSQSPNHSAFCRAAVNGASQGRELAKHVRKCVFSSWQKTSRSQANWASTAFLNMYFSALKYMENLHTLDLYQTPILPGLLHSLGTLENLRSLKLNDCRFENCKKPDFVSLSTLRLAHMYIEDEGAEDDANMDQFIESIDHSHLSDLKTCYTSSIKKLLATSAPLPLERISLFHIRDFQLTRRFFRQIPNLQELRINNAEADVFADLELGDSDLPVLNHVECPGSLLQHFLSGRPVSTVAVETFDGNGESTPISLGKILKVLSESSKPIRKLTIPCTAALECAKFDHSLQELHVQIPSIYVGTYEPVNPLVLKALCDTWSCLPPDLYLDLQRPDTERNVNSLSMDLRAQHTAILKFSASSTRLRRVVINQIGWAVSKNGQWELDMGADTRGVIVAELRVLAHHSQRALEGVLETIDFEDYWKKALQDEPDNDELG